MSRAMGRYLSQLDPELFWRALGDKHPTSTQLSQSERDAAVNARGDLRQWAAARNVSFEIAEILHEISTADRAAGDIWEDPTPTECATVAAKLPPGDGVYFWGDEIFDRDGEA